MPAGRPKRSKNQAGHNAGGARRGSGPKQKKSLDKKTPSKKVLGKIKKMMARLLRRDGEDGTEVLLKILVPLAQYVPQFDTRGLCGYLVEHVQGQYSHQSRRGAALCLVVLVATAFVRQLLEPYRDTLETVFESLGYETVWKELWGVNIPEIEEAEQHPQDIQSSPTTKVAQNRILASIKKIKAELGCQLGDQFTFSHCRTRW
ncbi:hypothetical protein B0H11DRAFT_1905868 [Mycena galericulata]|nr:hypothetical protein B0H11DRAFT_1905868 [Mycena galericulata]